MRIFSGVQPTGSLHIGNYFGAIKQWVDTQHEGEGFFCIVDLHAITTPYDEKTLKENILEKAIVYLAAGVNPEKANIFIQSRVKEHTELCWLLTTITPIGELMRMTQYKDKSAKHQKNAGAGLLNYPILMSADILLYDADKVPVGEDQAQHVELTRDIAKKFNHRFGDTFKLPQAVLPTYGARIMSLTEPKKKMSKSDPADSSISLFDSPEDIRKKIKRATTDTQKTIRYDKTKKPGISNLLTIYSIMSGEKIEDVEKEMRNKSYKAFKEELAETLVDRLEIFRKKKRELESRGNYVNEILHQGEERARKIAESKMLQVRANMGVDN